MDRNRTYLLVALIRNCRELPQRFAKNGQLFDFEERKTIKCTYIDCRFSLLSFQASDFLQMSPYLCWVSWGFSIHASSQTWGHYFAHDELSHLSQVVVYYFPFMLFPLGSFNIIFSFLQADLTVLYCVKVWLRVELLYCLDVMLACWLTVSPLHCIASKPKEEQRGSCYPKLSDGDCFLCYVLSKFSKGGDCRLLIVLNI